MGATGGSLELENVLVHDVLTGNALQYASDQDDPNEGLLSIKNCSVYKCQRGMYLSIRRPGYWAGEDLDSFVYTGPTVTKVEIDGLTLMGNTNYDLYIRTDLDDYYENNLGASGSYIKNLVTTDDSAATPAYGVTGYSTGNATDSGVFRDYTNNDFHLANASSAYWLDDVTSTPIASTAGVTDDFDGDFARVSLDPGIYSYEIIFPTTANVGTASTDDFESIYEWLYWLRARAFTDAYTANITSALTEDTVFDLTFYTSYDLILTSSLTTKPVVTVDDDPGYDYGWLETVQADTTLTVSNVDFTGESGGDRQLLVCTFKSLSFTNVDIDGAWDLGIMTVTGSGLGTFAITSCTWENETNGTLDQVALTSFVSVTLVASTFLVDDADYFFALYTVTTLTATGCTLDMTGNSDAFYGNNVLNVYFDTCLIDTGDLGYEGAGVCDTFTMYDSTIGNTRVAGTCINISSALTTTDIRRSKFYADNGGVILSGGVAGTAHFEQCFFGHWTPVSFYLEAIDFSSSAVGTLSIRNCGIYGAAKGVILTNATKLELYNTIFMATLSFDFGVGIETDTTIEGNNLVLYDDPDAWTYGTTVFENGIVKFAKGRTTTADYFEGFLTRDDHLTRRSQYLWFDNGGVSFGGNPTNLGIVGTDLDTPTSDLDGVARTNYDVGPFEDVTLVPAFVSDDLGIISFDWDGEDARLVVNPGRAYDAYGNLLELTERVLYEPTEWPFPLSSDSDGNYAYLCLRKLGNYYGIDYMEHPLWGYAQPIKRINDVELYLVNSLLELESNLWPYKVYYPPLDAEGMIPGVVLGRIYGSGVPPNLTYRSPCIGMKDGNLAVATDTEEARAGFQGLIVPIFAPSNAGSLLL